MSSQRSGTTGKRPFLVLGVIALLVFALDAASKYWALTHLGDSDRWFGDQLRLTLFHNEGLAWGLSVGSLTPLVTSLATLGLVALVLRVCRELAAIDRLAPLMLGLIGGAALANGLDVFLGPAGVVDFIALPVVGQEAVLNVADVAAALGLALCGRTVFVLSRAIARERQEPAAAFAMRASGYDELPMPVPVYDERRRPGNAVPRAVREPAVDRDDERRASL